MCFGCSKELPHGESSFEYTHNITYILAEKQNNFVLHTLIWRHVLTLIFGNTCSSELTLECIVFKKRLYLRTISIILHQTRKVSREAHILPANALTVITVNPLYNDDVCSKLSLMLK